MVPDPARRDEPGLIGEPGSIPESILVHVPGFRPGSSPRVVRLAGGTVNSSYRVETAAGRFVVRIHHPTAKTLGADHEREAKLHAVAAAAGLAPALVHVDATYRFMVMAHVDGATWRPADFGKPERLVQLGATLRTLHALPPPEVAPFDVMAVLERHATRLRESLPEEASFFVGLMDRAREALRRVESQQRPRTIIHNDLHHLNLVDADRLVLVDWEYAAVADPLLDLASVHAYYPQSVEHSQRLLEASGLAQGASPDMLRAATWLFVLMSYLWYRARRLAAPASIEDMATERGLLARLG